MNIVKRAFMLILLIFVIGFLIGILLNYIHYDELRMDGFIILAVIMPIIYSFLFYLVLKIFIFNNLLKLKKDIEMLNNDPLYEINPNDYPFCFFSPVQSLILLHTKTKQLFKNIIDFDDFVEKMKLKMDELFNQYISGIKKITSLTDVLKNNDLSITTRINKDEIQLNKNLERMEILKEQLSKSIRFSDMSNQFVNDIKDKVIKLEEIKAKFSDNKDRIQCRLSNDEEIILKIAKFIESADNIIQHIDILSVNMGVEVAKIDSQGTEVKVLSDEVKRNIQELYNNISKIKSFVEVIKNNYIEKLNDCSYSDELVNKKFAITSDIKNIVVKLDNNNKGISDVLKENSQNVDKLLLDTISVINEEEYLKGEINSYLEKFDVLITENHNSISLSEKYHKMFSRFVNEIQKITVIISTYDHLKEINIGLNKELELIINKLNILIEKTK